MPLNDIDIDTIYTHLYLPIYIDLEKKLKYSRIFIVRRLFTHTSRSFLIKYLSVS